MVLCGLCACSLCVFIDVLAFISIHRYVGGRAPMIPPSLLCAVPLLLVHRYICCRWLELGHTPYTKNSERETAPMACVGYFCNLCNIYLVCVCAREREKFIVLRKSIGIMRRKKHMIYILYIFWYTAENIPCRERCATCTNIFPHEPIVTEITECACTIYIYSVWHWNMR